MKREEDEDAEEDEEEDEVEDEEVKVKGVKLKHSKICKNFNKLKHFFEKTWDVNCSDVEIEYLGDQATNK